MEKCKIDLQENQAQFMQNCCVVLLQQTFDWVKVEF